MNVSRRRLQLISLILVLALGLAATATGQLQKGDLFGMVQDSDGEILPGVTVTLSGIGATQIQITDAQGRFRFLGLSPGTYQVTAELDGFSTVEYPNVVISVGRNTTLEISLSAAVEETITVTAESPLLDERKMNRGTNVSAAELDQIPTARDPWSLLSQAPAVVVDRINVGGNESGQQSNFLGAGSMGGDNTFAVDGMILTDMNAVGASLSYYDFGAFEEVQFTVSSTDVSVATSGVTVNQVTKRGNNNWRGSARYLRTDGDLQSDATILDSGLRGNQIDVVEEYGADIGGPLLRDRLWLWASYGESDIGNIVVGGQLDRTMLEDFNTKLNFQGTAANSGVVHYWTNDKLKNGRGAGVNRAPQTTHNQITPADIWKVEDSHVVGSNFFITGLWSTNDGVFNAAPQGGRDADVFTDADGVLHGSYWDFGQGAVIDQGRIDASYFFNTTGASHELKFGGGFRTQENNSFTVWPRGKMVYDCEFWGCVGTAPDVKWVQLWRNNFASKESSYDSAWVQDTIETDRWTINVGLRYDKQSVENLPSSSPAHENLPNLLPEIVFNGNNADGFEWESLVPRVGVTYALGKDRKTLLRGSFSQYAQQLAQFLGSRTSPVGGYQYAGFYFEDANGNSALDANEFGSLYYPYYYGFDPDNPTALSTVNRNDPGLDPAMTDEITFGIEHGVTPTFVIGATLTARTISDFLESRILVEDASGNIRPAEATDYVLSSDLATGTLPDGREVSVPVYNLSDSVSNIGGRFLTNGDREQDYLGLTLSVTKRLANRWRLNAHLTLSDWDWDIGDEFLFFDDPTNTTIDNNELALADGDEVVAERSAGSGNKGDIWAGSDWSFSVNGIYQVAPDKRWGFNVGASITGREGFVSPPYIPVSGGGLGSRRVQATELDEFRNDDIIVFDMRLEKKFEFGDNNFTLSLDGFNLLDEDYILQRDRNLASGSANQIREVISPRVFRVGIKLNIN